MFWFEFLLNPSLLVEHLQKPSPDLSATELIIKFLAVAADQKEAEKIEPKPNDGEIKFPDIKPDEGYRVSKKVLALRLLSLKVAAFLKWDLSVLETKLPLTMQVTLIQELLIMCLSRPVVETVMLNREEKYSGAIGVLGALAKEVACNLEKSRMRGKLEPQGDAGVALFALTLCHRWVIRAVRLNRIPTKQARLPYIPIPGLQDAWYIAPNIVEDIMRGLENLIPESIDVLEKVATLPGAQPTNYPSPLMPDFSSFTLPTEDSCDEAAMHDWSQCTLLSPQEFHCQIHYDLGAYFFFREKYASAKEHIQGASELFSVLSSYSNPSVASMLFCTVEESVLRGYISACQLESSSAGLAVTSSKSAQSGGGLLDQFFHSTKNMYMGMVPILQQDNLRREIPMVHRDVLELDIVGAASSGKFTVARDLPLQIQTLNVVRRALGEGTTESSVHSTVTTGDYLQSVQQRPIKAAELMINSLKPMLKDVTQEQRKRLKNMLTWIMEWGGDDNPEEDDLEDEEEEEGELGGEADGKKDGSSRWSLQHTLLSSGEVRGLFTPSELSHMEIRWRLQSQTLKDSKGQVIPTLSALDSAPWYSSSDFQGGNMKLVAGRLEQQVILSYNPEEIRQHLHALLSINSVKSLIRINTKWELPIPLHSVVMSTPRGFMQDFCFILLAKARELTEMKNYEDALSLFLSVQNEIRQNIGSGGNGGPFGNVAHKFLRLVSWEALLVQILQSLEQWPHVENPQELTARCRTCLGALSGSGGGNGTGADGNVLPRMELAELCAATLLNLHDWDYLCSLDVRRCPNLEFPCALAVACRHLLKFKGAKKVSRDTWDLVIPAFGPSSTMSSSSQGGSGGSGPHHHHHHHGGSGGAFHGHQHKRSSSGSTISVVHRSSSPSNMGSSSTPGGLTRSQLISWVERLRESTVLSVLASLLARLHNVLRDEPSLELNAEYTALWPAVLSNANSYNTRAVAEMLWQLVSQALTIYPRNVGYLKLMGDLNFVMNHYAASIKYYLQAVIVVSNFFGQLIPRSVIDDTIYRRMIKCCTQLQCHTQAAVLCQFLEEVDYNTAFKSLGERGGSTADAADAHLSSCIWDITLLEFLVHLHAKRGEIHRKQQAIKVIGLLELNSNNNEEIQREAANIRKSRFLRAMARQYVI
ncbi:integrator complex subunit 8 [Ischnura elegans]|uniref:integrator complex subunit 8 n=1 Tax=Ischnura elegans TaxID=197161 RepID=UPI001ED8B9B8|nr:integrator complex subunit 8 [Ischnura elegans]